MISWTTPTQPIYVVGANLPATGCEVHVTFTRGCHDVTIKDPPMEYLPNYELDGTVVGATRLDVTLTQEQSGQLGTGTLQVQVNLHDWMGWRDATMQGFTHSGSNLLREVI